MMAAAAALVHELHPGDVAVATRGERLKTLLGSCVAILLTDPRRTVGGLCHVVHPGRADPGALRPTAWGDDALQALFARLRRHGIEPRMCQAWVCGGGHLFPGRVGLTPAHGHVGAANAQWALRALRAQGIEPLGVELGGFAWRRLAWTVGPGAPELCVVPVPTEGALS
jgi:chemotaxis protein CheD